MESGLAGSPSAEQEGLFLTRYILILVPDQILIPELWAQLPCKANPHITAMSPGHRAALQTGLDCAELLKPKWVWGLPGACPSPWRLLAATGQHSSNKHHSP